MKTDTAHPSRLCVSLFGGDFSIIAGLIDRVAGKADVLEFRLDSFAPAADGVDAEEYWREIVTRLLELSPCPALFTNRPAWEGGKWQGSEEERVLPLSLALDLGAAFVDIELRTAEDLRLNLLRQAAEARRRSQPTFPGSSALSAKQNTTKQEEYPPARVIVSWHDFETTPGRNSLTRVLQRQQESGADIGKIVGTAFNRQDVLRVLSLQQDAAETGFPLIAFAMGPQGGISRLATCFLGGYMTYAAADKDAVTAPGQLSAERLRLIEELLVNENASLSTS